MTPQPRARCPLASASGGASSKLIVLCPNQISRVHASRLVGRLTWPARCCLSLRLRSACGLCHAVTHTVRRSPQTLLQQLFSVSQLVHSDAAIACMARTVQRERDSCDQQASHACPGRSSHGGATPGPHFGCRSSDSQWPVVWARLTFVAVPGARPRVCSTF